MNEANKKKKFERAQKALEIAQRLAEKADKQHNTCAVSNQVSAINFHPGYAYEDEGEESLVTTGNWNEISKYNSETNEHVTISDLPVRLSLIFEKLGFEVEWDDQWAECNDCYKIVRTDPDSFGFIPQYIEHAGAVICKKCLEEYAEGTLYEYTFKPTSECLLTLTPTLRRVPDDET